MTAVNTGLAAGDHVVIDGADRLRDGLHVNVSSARRQAAGRRRRAGSGSSRADGGGQNAEGGQRSQTAAQ